MTKKNVAALMLAGAMMTVGSGAMADTTITNDTVGLTGTATASASSEVKENINVTVSWKWEAKTGENEITGETPDFVFTWEQKDGAYGWKCNRTEASLKFTATNNGSKKKLLSISKAEGSSTLLEEDATQLTATPVERGVSSEDVGVFKLTPKMEGADSAQGTGEATTEFTFNVLVGDVTEGA